MGSDRFVYWPLKGPKRDDIKRVLEDYLGDAKKHVYVDGARITVTLVGAPSWPFRRILSPELANQAAAMAALVEDRPERFFEVYCTNTYTDVITREGDEYTSVVADGFATLIARYWEGRRTE